MASTDSVKVALRIRPQNPSELSKKHKICTQVSGSQVHIGGDKSFSFDNIFNTSSSQSDVYNACVGKLVGGAFNGLNATVLAYGQTGSGKTHTMGTNDANIQSESVGIIPRAISQLFQTIDESKKESEERKEDVPKFLVEVQFIELYNEDLMDLLTNKRNTNVKIHEDAESGEILIKNATKLKATNIQEIMQILKTGSLNRATASTSMNQQSSRSHAIFSVHIKQEKFEPITNSDEKVLTVLTSKLHFVDLAGSERLKRTGAVGDRAKEGISINYGLLALGNVICALTDPKNTHVPYRNSKLTRLLQDSLGGNSQTLMIACVSPSEIDAIETLNTLTYASRAKGIQNRVVINRDYETKQINQLKLEIARLQNELRAQKTDRGVVAQIVNEEPEKKEEKEVNVFEEYNKVIEEVLEEFKRRVNSVDLEKEENKDEKIEKLGLEQKGLIEISDEFHKNLQESINILFIPSRAKTRRLRRTTIFNPNAADRKRITALVLDRDENELPREKAKFDGDSENLKQELEEAKMRIKQLEEECKITHEKSSATVSHLTKAMFDLKEELAISIQKKNLM